MYLDVADGSVGNFTATEVENAFKFTVPTGSGSTTVDNNTDTEAGNNILGNGSVSNPLEPGQSFDFGLEIDLLDEAINDLPDEGEYTLIIEALTANNNN
jgi:hypothetical protein